ncbi:Aspartate/glutamate/uridylate kinase [Chlamydoabsidia padenii]|nr:Aspartate/glutamate/uridylate kinase [Chlamydoabsidia padenii]
MMKKKKTVIVKLGGAAITEKQQENQLSPSLDNLMTQIQQAYLHSTSSLILIHGAGGFGHPPAQQYHIKQGWHDTVEKQNKLVGFALTRCQVLDLHHCLLKRLVKLALPVVSVSPFEHPKDLVKRVDTLLSLGFVPLLFGDAVLDDAQGCTILSGDQIMLDLARSLVNVERCVYVTDVPGVFTANPKNDPDAALISHMIVGDKEQVVDAKMEHGVVDVTGGMQGKMACARQIIQSTSVSHVIICQSGSSALDYVLKYSDFPHLPYQEAGDS